MPFLPKFEADLANLIGGVHQSMKWSDLTMYTQVTTTSDAMMKHQNSTPEHRHTCQRKALTKHNTELVNGKKMS